VAEDKTLPLGSNEDQDDQDFILGLLGKHSGSQEKFKKRWIEFDCLKGVHHGKYATYENGKRIRVKGGYLGRFDKVKASGSYGEKRVEEFVRKHDCHYPERLYKDLEECGISRIGVEGWPSGRSVSGLSDGGRHSGSEEHGI
jgi:hypothetical protein